ncbi:hypothetical protein DE146DRAFT_411048 [Phaeosphaeria sp. MPI-PUGE-AT-0046c]|nr:hypothetical protein DE146DRAFT_411048 [Phaeosphaeria sp. MPI-PUGE-AT-0046c]
MPPYRPQTMYIHQRSTMAIRKRDNMGFAIAPSLIIFLVILGSGFLVCCLFAVFRFYGEEPGQHVWQKRSHEQDMYMKDVRDRNRMRMYKPGGRHLIQSSNQDLAHAPAISR